jgi:hypothetical protein
VTTFVEQVAKTRRQDSRDEATAEYRTEKAAERQRREKIRQENAAAWYEFEMRLAENHRLLSEEHEAKAKQLLEVGERRGEV